MSNVIHPGSGILITGGAGYLGSALAQEINVLGGKAIKVSSRKLPPEEDAINVFGNICDPNFWLKILPNVDTVFHFAANTSVAYAESYSRESLTSALDPIDHLISAASVLKRRPKVIFASTATVYGLTPDLPVSELTIPRPITNYDLHKLFVEEKLGLASRMGVIESISVRLSNIYGPSFSMIQDGGRGVVNKAVKSALEHKTLNVYGGGGYVRDYIFIDDVISAFLALKATSAPSGLIVNVGSGKGITLLSAFKTIADSVREVIGEAVDLNIVDWPMGSLVIDQRNYVANINLIKGICGWEPKTGLQDGISALLRYYLRSSNNGI